MWYDSTSQRAPSPKQGLFRYLSGLCVYSAYAILHTVPSTASSQGSLMTLNPDDNGGDHINVVVRVRPLTALEHDGYKAQALNYPGEGQVLVEEPASGQTKLFTFTVVFEPEATQEDVFEHCGIKRLIDMALDGFASTIMAYGQTGAGKTYTLTGPPEASEGGASVPGIMQLAFGYLFGEITQRRGVEYIVQASYLEVYKEHVLDLLNPSHKTLPVRWSKDKGFYAENLFVVECEDLGDLDGVLQEGRKNRQVRSHEMNEYSSRSHSILTINLASDVRDPDDPNIFIRRQGKLSLVDLAGSEKTKKTRSRGNTLVEANNINKSLLVLGNCISCLADPKKRTGHIPYRDSTLTKLLADSLGGSGMALIIACISPSSSNAHETINTLRYASRAKRVKTKPMVRMDPRELLILSLRREVRLLRMENSYLRQQMLNAGGSLHLSNVLTVGDELSEDDDEKELLHKYMTENEALRTENATMHHLREMLVRDHELVCRENERLIKKLDALEKTSAQQRQPTATEKTQESAKPQTGARADAKVTKHSAASNQSSTRESPKLTPTVRKIGRSLNDIGGGTLVAQPRGVEQGGRRNSWGTSGIPKLRQKLSTNPLVAALAPKRVLRRTASNRVTPADTKRSSASQTGMN
ncbi:kinesin-like protein KIF12 isoform X4 [Dermacentor albipictus]|uniref:kinesin-like protein KIF12 isoform X4 n=1 Tax=Dermacentor albipictus TaxID=60249 RepID=UPI0031FD0379